MNPISAQSAISQIAEIQEAARSRPAAGAGNVAKTETSGFADLIRGYVKETNDAQILADGAIEDFATGKSDNVEQVVLAMTQADISFQMFMEIRNKLIDSYTELMRMQF